MVNSAKRVRRRKLAQAQRREGSRSAHQMDPFDLSLSRPETDEHDVEDREILFVPRMQKEEESPPVLYTVQVSPDCEIIDSKWGDSLRFSGHRTNPEGLRSAARG